MALLAPVAAALTAPLAVEPPGWKRPLILAGVLAAAILTVSGAAGATLPQALRICVLGLALGLLAAGTALNFRRPGLGQLAAALLVGLLIGGVFLLRPAIAARPDRARPALALVLGGSPHAVLSQAAGADFLRQDFFYRVADPVPADFAHLDLIPPWHRPAAIWAGAGVLLGALGLGLRSLRRAGG